MKESRWVKVGIILLLILLTVDIGSRILLEPSEAKAAGNVEYKIFNERIENIEQSVNNMTSQGWELHSVVGIDGMSRPLVILKK